MTQARYAAGTLAAAVLGLATVSSGATVSLIGPIGEHGTGFGNTLVLLALEAKGSATDALGGIDGNGELYGDAKKPNQIVTVADLMDEDITADNFCLIFNINEGGVGESLWLNRFTVDFYGPTGAKLFDSAVFDGPTEFEQLDGGTGKGGRQFKLTLDGTEAGLLFGDTGNRIGMSASLSDVHGGAECFYVYAGSVTPLPAGAWMGIIGLGALGVRRIVRRQR